MIYTKQNALDMSHVLASDYCDTTAGYNGELKQLFKPNYDVLYPTLRVLVEDVYDAPGFKWADFRCAFIDQQEDILQGGGTYGRQWEGLCRGALLVLNSLHKVELKD